MLENLTEIPSFPSLLYLLSFVVGVVFIPTVVIKLTLVLLAIYRNCFRQLNFSNVVPFLIVRVLIVFPVFYIVDWIFQ